MVLFLFIVEIIATVTYDVSPDQPKLTVSGVGITSREEVINYCSISEIQIIEIMEGITEIGPSSFSFFHALTSVKFSSSINKLRDSCFFNCDNLQSMIIPNSVDTIEGNSFHSCTSLKSIVLPSSLKVFDSLNSLRSCNSLESIDISNCEMYSVDPNKTILIKNNNEAVYCIFAKSTIIIDKKVEIVASYFLSYHHSVNTILFEEGSRLKEVKKLAFEHSGLQKVIFPTGLKKIGKNPFGGSNGLSYVYIPATLSEFDSLFQTIPETVIVEPGCEALNIDQHGVIFDKTNSTIVLIPKNITTFIVPSTVTEIDYSVLRSATKLTTLRVLEGNENFSAYDNLLYNKNCSVCYSCIGGITKAVVNSSCEIIYDGAFGSYNMKEVYLPDSVTSLGSTAFMGAYSMNRIRLSPNVSYVGSWCFSGSFFENIDFVFTEKLTELHQSCFTNSRIRSIDLGKCIKIKVIPSRAFQNAVCLKEIILPPEVSTISEKSFNNCKSLESISIPSTLTNMQSESFSGCKSLSNISFENCIITEIQSFTFKECNFTQISIPNEVTSIAQESFSDCFNLIEVIFSEESKLQTANIMMFNGCKSLKHVHFGPKMVDYKPKALSGTESLISISVSEKNPEYCSVNDIIYTKDKLILVAFPPGLSECNVNGIVQEFADSAFYQCRKLKELFLDEKLPLKTIGSYTFTNCTSLYRVQIPSKTSVIKIKAFYNCINLSIVVFSKNNELTEITASMFEDCLSLVAVSFGEGSQLRHIRDRAFKGCKLLSEFQFTPNFETIGISAFEGCSSISYVWFPSTITAIGADAFRMCSGINFVGVCWEKDSEPGSSFSPIGFSNSGAKFVNVPNTFQSDTFCGLPILRSLDEDCHIPTLEFTGIAVAVANKCSIVGVTAAMVNGESPMENPEWRGH